MTEEWRAIPGYEGYYSASSLGRVRSEPRVVPSSRWGWQSRPGGIVAQKQDRGGYMVVGLRRDGRRWYVGAHRLVCLAFHGQPPSPEHEAAHYPNPDRSLNTPDNLRWASPLENQRHRVEHGTDQRGERNFSAKLTAADVAQIRARYRKGRPCHPGNQAELAAEFGVCARHVQNIARGSCWNV